ncbi:MAG: phosphoenolpyruvate--protein phosphotransferase [Thermosphaera sp.]
MQSFKGIIASPGISIGKLEVYNPVRLEDFIPLDCRYSVDTNKKVAFALNKYVEYLNEIKQFSKSVDESLLEAYELLGEALLQEGLELAISKNICIEKALVEVYGKYSKMLSEAGSELFQARESDLKQITSDLLLLINRTFEEVNSFDKGGKIIIAEEMHPLDFVRESNRGLKGLVTKRGGLTSHVSLLARSSEIPYLIIPDINPEALENYTGQAIVDGINGIFIVNPSEEVIKKYTELANNTQHVRSILNEISKKKIQTLDGFPVDVLCNVNSLEEARVGLTQGCEGIGLFRTEYLYMRNSPPSEETLSEVFTKVGELYNGAKVVIRAPDLGGDKQPPYLRIDEENPFLGLRGIRTLLEYRDELLKPFTNAYLRSFMKHKNLKILLPMASKLTEIREFIEYVDQRMVDIGVDPSRTLISIGVMIEVPSMAIITEKLGELKYVDFVSYGTNDLTQYTLAVDRGNQRVAHLYSELEPSVLRLIRSSVEKAKSTGLEVEVCGEAANNPLMVPLFLSMGVDALSVPPQFTGIVKFVASKLKVSEISKVLDYVLGLEGSREVFKFLQDYLLKLSGELEILKPWMRS